MKPYYGGIRHDYKLTADAPRLPRWRQWCMFGVGVALPLISVVLLLTGKPSESNPPAAPIANLAIAVPAGELLRAIDAAPAAALDAAQQEAPAQTREISQSPVRTPALTLAAATPDEASALAGNTPADNALTDDTPVAALPADADLLELIVARNDTLDALFRRNGLSISDLAEMLDIPLAAEPLRRLIPGDRLNVVHRGSQVLSLERELRDDALLSITREPSGFTATEIPRDIEIRVVGRHGVVRSSLFEAGMAAEIPDAVIMRMAGIFQWDIDFILDVRVDDQFTLLYEERWREGEFLGTGSLLAAEYVNRGERYRVVRFEDPSGHADYYTEDGHSVRKAFVRAPVEFTRISSSFNPNRRHPVLNTIRAHRGVDYAAPTGTPVIAAGAGKVIRRSAYGSFGNTVIVQHGGNIQTLYAHLSRFARPQVGARVEQGDVIGYVGQSGLASGPHLHYEYRIDGVHRNPRTVDLPPADPVPESFRAQFAETTQVLWQELEAFRSSWIVAAN